MNAISVLNVYLNLTNHIVVGKQGEKRAQFFYPNFRGLRSINVMESELSEQYYNKITAYRML
jgi:hypothetical protein